MSIKRTLQITFTLLPDFINYLRDRRTLVSGQELSASDRERLKRHARSMVDKFIKLGPTFIKLGQLLSVRSDVLPQEYMDEFARLQDEVPPSPFDDILRVIKEEYGKDPGEIFEYIDPTPLSAASIGQVHRAQYKGKEVIIKVRRPMIERHIEDDYSALTTLLKLIRRVADEAFSRSFEAALEQFYSTIWDEMNYKKEAKNAKQIANELKGVGFVIVPQVFEELTTTRVLVMELLKGTKVTNTKDLDRLGVNRKEIARRLSWLYMKMLLRSEIFHADPHPGNISVSDNGKIILYDFGMVGRLTKEFRNRLLWLYYALSTKDPEEIVNALIDMRVLDPFVNRQVIVEGVALALQEFEGREVMESDVKMLMSIANRVIYRFPFRLPKELVLYLRMGLLLDSVCRALDNDFNFLVVLPGILEEEGLIREYYLFRAKKALSDFSRFINDSVKLPSLMERYYSDQLYRNNSSRNKAQTVLLAVIVVLLIILIIRV